MADIVPPSPSQVDDHSLAQWHTVFKTPWDVLIGLGYVDGATLALHAGKIDALAASAGEVILDESDSTRTEKELSTAGEDVWAVSTSASDTTSISVVGVNSDGDSETVLCTLNGTTPVQVVSAATDDAWLNINRAVNAGAAAFVGVVYVSTKSSAGTPDNTDNIQILMEVGTEYASNPMVMAGNSEVLVFTGMDITAANKDEIVIFISRRVDNSRPWIKVFKVFAFEAFLPYRFIVPVVISAGQKIAFTGAATTNNTDMTWQASYYSLAQPTIAGGGVGILFSP